MNDKEFWDKIGISVIEKDGILYVNKVTEHFIHYYTELRTVKTDEQLKVFLNLYNDNSSTLDGFIKTIVEHTNNTIDIDCVILDEIMNNIYVKKEYRQYKIMKIKNGH